MTPAELMACTNAVSRFAVIRSTFNKRRVPHVKVILALCPLGFVVCLGGAGPTAAQAAVGGQLQGSLRAVPAVPGKLVLALLDAALGSCGHAAGVDQVGLQTEDRL